jgi:hypothetical protein
MVLANGTTDLGDLYDPPKHGHPSCRGVKVRGSPVKLITPKHATHTLDFQYENGDISVKFW